jgi:hypothetical protein
MMRSAISPRFAIRIFSNIGAQASLAAAGRTVLREQTLRYISSTHAEKDLAELPAFLGHNLAIRLLFPP